MINPKKYCRRLEVDLKKEGKLKITYACHSRSSIDVNKVNKYVWWHNRLGHSPLSRIKKIGCINDSVCAVEGICLTCRMENFCKLRFDLSKSCTSNSFELIHMDIWGAIGFLLKVITYTF